MPSIEYIAIRRVHADHTLNDTISRDISAYSILPSWDVQKDEAIALNGDQETNYHNDDDLIVFTSRLIARTNLTSDYWYEFLASIIGGESFTFDPYGTIASPDDAQTYIMVGKPRITPVSRLGDHRVSFTARKIS